MTWIQEYRESVGMSREQFARAITQQLGGRGEKHRTVTAKLIYILENWPGCVTHPKLATMIARACGATPQQRDMIVAKAHRGTWRGTDGPKVVYQTPPTRLPGKAKAEPVPGDRYANNNKAVVVIDRAGIEVRRFKSGIEAADFMDISKSSVYGRCAHTVPMEFAAGKPYTCRYAQEWDALTPTAKALSIRRALELSRVCKPRANGWNLKRSVVVVTKDGRELTRYPSIGEASRGECFNIDCIRNRCNRLVKQEFRGQHEATYRFADEWDGMTAEQRAKDLGAAM